MSLSRLVLVAVLASTLLSCNKKDDPVAPYGKMTFTFSNEVDGQAINMGPLSYTNAAGNKYSVDLLKYYVTNVVLVRKDGTEKAYEDYHLIDASNPASLSFSYDSVASGTYTAMRFSLGVDVERNHTGVQEGALDPANGMIWTWNTGYIFFKHEGNYKDNTGATKPVVFHYGTDKALVRVTVPMSDVVVAGNTKKVKIRFNLNEVYTNPSNIDFNVDNNHQSTDPNDAFWINTMKANFPDAFTFASVE